MLNACASYLTEKLLMQGIISDERKPIYLYGFTLMLSTLGCMLSILILSAVFGQILAGICFLTIFISLRLFAGGYHAKSYLSCFILTNLIFISSFIISVIFASVNFFTYSWILAIPSSITIFLLAPIRHKNHPLSEIMYKKNRYIAKVLVLIFFTGFSVTTIIGEFPMLTTITSVSLMAVAIMMIVANCLERRSAK